MSASNQSVRVPSVSSPVSAAPTARRDARHKKPARGPSLDSASPPEKGVAPAAGFLRRLGVFGFDQLEPVILAALVTGEPILLVGLHGTAKSMLLLRLAEALGLESRHYNASLLNYDDLVGYPLPDKNGELRFVETPASIWPAEVVFLDEISRCRVDMQNRLFPILHERKVQGIPLSQLRYCWAAMNPPADISDPDEDAYLGSERLDHALADRFSFLVTSPSWGDLSEADREAVTRCKNEPVPEHLGQELREIVERAKTCRSQIEVEYGDRIVAYVCAVVGLLAQASIPLSPRRAGMLHRNIVATLAAERVLRRGKLDVSGALLLAVDSSLPQRAGGLPSGVLQVVTSHRQALPLMRGQLDVLRTRLLTEASPVRRVLFAMACPALPPVEFSAIVADGLAGVPDGGRHAIACHLFERGQADRLLAAVAEQVASYYSQAAVGQTAYAKVRIPASCPVWSAMGILFGQLPKRQRTARLLRNVLIALYESAQIKRADEVGEVWTSWSLAWAHIERGVQ